MLIDMSKVFLKNVTFRKILISMILVFFIVIAAVNFSKKSEYYAYHCKYIYDRHVKTAFWLRDNTKEGDVIGTHDIGAIGFYSKRKVIDIAGLINPDLMKESYRDDYNEVVTDYFNKKDN